MSEENDIDQPVTMRQLQTALGVQSEGQRKTPIKFQLASSEHIKLVGFLVTHTVVIIGLAWTYTRDTDRRLTSLEIRGQVTLEAVNEVKTDVRALTIHQTPTPATK